MRKRLILVIVGMPGSGKSTAADILARRLRGFSFHSGDIIREEVRRRGLPYTPENDKLVAQWFHTGGREKLLARRVWAKVKGRKEAALIIEGPRSPKQVRELERLSGQKVHIIRIVVPFRIRAARETLRHRFRRGETLAYLRFRDADELRRGLGRLMKKADFSVSNSKTRKALEKELAKLIKNKLAKL